MFKKAARDSRIVAGMRNVWQELQLYDGEEIVADVHPLHLAVQQVEAVCCPRDRVHDALFLKLRYIWFRLIHVSRGSDHTKHSKSSLNLRKKFNVNLIEKIAVEIAFVMAEEVNKVRCDVNYREHLASMNMNDFSTSWYRLADRDDNGVRLPGSIELEKERYKQDRPQRESERMNNINIRKARLKNTDTAWVEMRNSQILAKIEAENEQLDKMFHSNTHNVVSLRYRGLFSAIAMMRRASMTWLRIANTIGWKDHELLNRHYLWLIEDNKVWPKIKIHLREKTSIT